MNHSQQTVFATIKALYDLPLRLCIIARLKNTPKTLARVKNLAASCRYYQIIFELNLNISIVSVWGID